MDSSFSYMMCAAATSFFALLVTLFFMFYKKFRYRENNETENLTSSSLLSPPSSLPRNWIHNVFPSFHGADVRISFLSHVLKEFKSKGITPFIDNEIKRGEFIGPELIEAIRGSRIAIVLLSKRYASSSWCLDELVEIINGKQDLGQTVMVIFYKVDPTDVKKQTGDFGKVFRKTCKGKTMEVIGRWKQALAKVATIAGYHSSNWVDEAAMIENIATDISNMLNHLAPSPDMDRLIGMGGHMAKIYLLLRLHLDEVRMIGIWGPPGIGKSTIARFLFNQLSNSFQFRAIMVNIKGNYPRPCLDEYSAQLQLQNQMLSQIINHKDTTIPHLGVAQERLKDKNVLLVLDDVDQLAQLDALAREIRWFGPGSRIIITTEDLRVLNAHRIDHIYKVEFPSYDEALQMFCMYAFDQKAPKDGFTKLSHEITYLVGYLPLGLKVMGSYFRGMSRKEWTRALPRLRSRLHGDIESILKFSYDALCDEDKDLFLHIACFFNNEEVEKVEEHLSNKFLDVRQGLHVLAEKSLISNVRGWIEMHSLLVQLGKEIVRKQSDHEPGKRQFLVDTKDINEVLSDPTAITRSVIGINGYTLNWDNISEKGFEKMYNLQFLRLHGGRGHPNIEALPELLINVSPKLQLLDWKSSPMTCLPFVCNLEFLVELKMPYSKLEKLWDGIKLLKNLKWMDLSQSEKLKELPDLSNAINLQILNLSECIRLVELPSSIGNATNLRELDISFCRSLVELPFSIGNATNLQKLNLGDCSNLVKPPSSIGNATNLKELKLSGCFSLVELPSSIGNATNLQELNHICCSSLVELPSSIGNLHRLSKLYMWGCSKLEVLPTNINLESLIVLDLTDCWSLKSFPEISTNIEVLKLIGTAIEEVPSSITSWSHLKKLEMSYSENLEESPHALDRITKLSATNKKIKEIGQWVNRCSRLVELDVSGCTNLVSLPQLPDSLESLNAKSCFSLENPYCCFCNPVIRLNFENCNKLNQEARGLIIQAPTSGIVVLPGGDMLACFTYRARGSSVTVKVNEKHVGTLIKFKACILLGNKRGLKANRMAAIDVDCHFTVWSKQTALTSSSKEINTVSLEHLYIFGFEAEEVTSTELVFEFELETDYEPWEIEEIGILQLM